MRKILRLGILITVVTIAILYLVLDFMLVPKQTGVSNLLQRQNPSEFYFYVDGREQIFSNQADIYEFNKIVIDKTAKRVKRSEAKELIGKELAVFDWGYKGRTCVISEKGRILINVPKPDIRKKSRMHWFWWKINVFIDRSNYIPYITDPDKRVTEKMLEIKGT